MSMKKKLNIAFAGGGTWWHVTPISSLITYAQSQPEIMEQVKWLFRFGSYGQMEEKFCKNLEWVTFVSIRSGKLRRYRTVTSTLENLRDVAYFNAGYLQSLYYLQQHKIDVVFCKGGYVALPVVLAAASLRIPVIVHESDFHAWLVNKIASRVAKKTFDWFPWVLENSTHIGQILSPDLLNPDEDIDVFTGKSQKKTMIVICGSQGSEAIFQALLSELDTWWQVVKNLNIVIILWILNGSYRKKFEPHLWVMTYDFLNAHELATIYEMSDLALTRWSATTLAELEYFSLPKVIVPLPSHDQPLNAAWYMDKKWDIVVQQDNLSELWAALQFHLDHPRKKEESKKDFFDAHRTIWETLLSK